MKRALLYKDRGDSLLTLYVEQHYSDWFTTDAIIELDWLVWSKGDDNTAYFVFNAYVG